MIPEAGPDIWSSADWQASMTSWVDARVHEHGIHRTGVDPTPRIRTWAAVFCFPTDHGDVWFKAASNLTAHEMALYPVLTSLAPHWVLRPLAVDTERAWLLLPDGGISMMHKVPHDQLVDRLESVIPAYARLQIALMPATAAMVSLGVPDMRPERMPDRFDEALIAIRRLARRFPEPGDAVLLARIVAFRPEYIALCEELSVSPIPPTLDHGDLHTNNILTGCDGTPRFYDWGDSAVAHPFATMLEFTGPVARMLDIPLDHPTLDRLCDAYLEPFGDFQTLDLLRETLQMARRVAMVSRALTFANILALGPLPDPSWNRGAIRWMARLLEP